MKTLLILMFLLGYIHANIPLSNEQITTINNAMEKLKNDKDMMNEFFFMRRMSCYSSSNVGNDRYIKSSLAMQMNTYFKIGYKLLGHLNLNAYFKNKFTKGILYNERVKLSKNQELYQNKKRDEYWTAYYVCEKLNLHTEDTILEYKEFIENNKKNLVYNSYLYDTSINYLNNKYYYRPLKSISSKKQIVIKEENKKFENTAIVKSLLTDEEYIAEASAIRASIWLSNLKIDVPKQFIDDLGREGSMKNKPIIATAKKFKEFMDYEFKSKTITIETNDTSDFNYLKKKFGDEKGLYIFIPKDINKFGLTGYVTIWEGMKSHEERGYYQNNEGTATLYIFSDKTK